MNMKIKEYINTIKNKLTKDNIFSYYEEFDSRKFRTLSIFLDEKSNKPYIWFDSLFVVDAENELNEYWKNLDFNPDNFIETTRDEWLILLKKEIQDWINDLKSKKPQEFERYREHLEKDGGKIIYEKYNNTYQAFIGVAASDEDFYWVCIDRKGKLTYHTCVGYLDFITEKDDKTGYEYKLLKEYIKKNKENIKEILKNTKYDIIFDTIFNNN